ncbi:aldose 1-epimerase [Melghiribacillus thermohalophilus]|uniref:Aldose 1-epimerase n=2 Tax=Melghiribacillus thermohalophilus TaxID=1324956 RepID=A0A4R3MVD8_9BACI|nr:aldose 1-epimerase [Melghiribacillus thermohalophilus]
MKVNTKMIKVTDGQRWKLFHIENNRKMTVEVLNFGGIITQIRVPDRNGLVENIVLGYKHYRDYIENPAFFGAIIGRVAGRIRDAQFVLRGRTFHLGANEGSHHLHGGNTHFHQVLWDAVPFQSDYSAGVILSHTSPDGEGGYPGNVTVQVRYELYDWNEFRITYRAETDEITPLALTNHTYFNLSGDVKDTIEKHEVQLKSGSFLELDEVLLPTGKRLDVEQTPFDFRSWRRIRDGIQSAHPQNRIVGNGYDHYFLFEQQEKEKVKVKEKISGRVMVVESDEPGMVMYTGNNLDESFLLREGYAKKYGGLCIETQRHPASLLYEGLPSVILKPEQTFETSTSFTFYTE